MALSDLLRLGRRKQTSEVRPPIAGLFELSGSQSFGRARTTAALLEAYSTSPRLRAVVSKIAYEVATTEWLAFRETSSAQRGLGRRISRAAPERRREALVRAVKQQALEPVEGASVLDFLDAGNPLQGGIEVLHVTQVHIDLTGDGFWLLEADRAGQPLAAWPLPPPWVTKVPSPGGSNEFTIRPPGTGGGQVIPAELMLWFSDPDPRNPWGRGSGLGSALWDEIQTDEMAARYMRTVFGNRARPDFLASIEGGEDRDVEAFESGWINKFRGWWNAGRPLVTNRKVTLERLGQTFEELQLTDLRTFERDFIVQVYGVPPEKLGILENSNRATIHAADLTFAKNVLLPRIERLRNVMQNRLLPRFAEEGIVLDFVSPVESDRQFELEVMRAQPSAFRVDEWRARAGEEPLADGGDRRLVPINLLEQSRRPEVEKGRARTKVTRLDIDLEGVVGQIAVDDLLDAITPGLREAAAQLARETAAEAGIPLTFDPDANVRIREFLEREAAERMVRVSDTTKAAIRRTLVEGLEGNESLQQLSTRVTEVFEQASNARALAVARTETVAAGTVGSEAAMEETGVQEKQWLCLAGDVPVRGFGIHHAARRWHTGNLVTLRTPRDPSGITMTPDHQVLTRRGWIAAHLVEQGDELVSYEADIERLDVGRVGSGRQMPHVDHMPPPIAEVFNTLHEAGSRIGSVSVVMNLDGKGRDGDIEVVKADRELLGDVEPLVPQHLRNLLLELSDVAIAELVRSGSLLLDGNGHRVHGIGRACGSELGTSLLRRQERRSHLPSFALASQMTPRVLDDPSDGLARGTVPLAKRLLRRSGGVLFGYDRCLSKEIVPGGCHVYDLSSTNQWLIAGNGLIVHNSSRDGNVRDAHLPGSGSSGDTLDGQHVALGRDFVDVNGATGPGPGRMNTAASSANCRCTLIPFISDERSLMATEEKATAVWKTRERLRLPIERRVRADVRRGFAVQRDAVLAALRRQG